MRTSIRTGVIFLALGGCVGPALDVPVVDAGMAAREAQLQQELFLVGILNGISRARTVYDPLIRANANLCPNAAKKYVGAAFFHVDQFPAEYRVAAGNILGSRNRVVIWDTFSGSPAHNAGLRPGDVVLAINGSEVVGLLSFQKLIEEAVLLGSSVDIIISRDGASRSTKFTPVQSCDYGIAVSPSAQLNAWADGESVVITMGMLEFLQNEDELALVLGHELAHNVLRHIEKTEANLAVGALIGGMLGAFLGLETFDVGAQVGAGVFSQKFESEADYAGVYFAARAGFDVSRVANVWRRLALRNPESIDRAGTTHPSSAIRFAAIEQTVAEISDKLRLGLPIVPNLNAPR